jgi:hypothetical protein
LELLSKCSRSWGSSTRRAPQVYSSSDTAAAPSITKRFPKIKLINWFDMKKSEAEAQVGAAAVATDHVLQ